MHLTRPAAQAATAAPSDFTTQVFFTFCVMVALCLVPVDAMAGYVPSSGNDPISAVYAAIVRMVTGTTGKAIATAIFIALGVGALVGRITWPQALTVTAGVALIFGSISILNTIGGSEYGFSNDITCHANNTVCDVFKNIVGAIATEAGASICALCVIALGLAASMGRLSWPRAFMLIAGIGLFMGSADIIKLLWSDAPSCTAGLDSFSRVLCTFMAQLQGGAGKAMGTIGVIIMGILAMLGRISWQMGLIVMAGIAMIFGAQNIVDILANGIASRSCGNGSSASLASMGAIEGVLCQIVMLISGPGGKALATAAVAIMGFGAMIGKVNYGTALVIAAGIGLAFGAPKIANLLTGYSNPCVITVTTGTPC